VYTFCDLLFILLSVWYNYHFSFVCLRDGYVMFCFLFYASNNIPFLFCFPVVVLCLSSVNMFLLTSCLLNCCPVIFTSIMAISASMAEVSIQDLCLKCGLYCRPLESNLFSFSVKGMFAKFCIFGWNWCWFMCCLVLVFHLLLYNAESLLFCLLYHIAILCFNFCVIVYSICGHMVLNVFAACICTACISCLVVYHCGLLLYQQLLYWFILHSLWM
jgi:hypothetical protein